MNAQEVQMNTSEFEPVIKGLSFLGITREFIDICNGNWPQTRLLGAIVYWFRPGVKGHSRAVKYRDGLYWVYKTAEEWRAEIGLSEWEFRTALNALEATGLIERRSMKASNSTGQWVKQLHLSLNKNLLAKMIDAVQAIHDYPHAAAAPDVPLTPVVTPTQNCPILLVNPPSQSIMSESQNVSTEGSSLKTKTSTKTGGEKPAKELIGEENTKTTGVEKIETIEKEENIEKVGNVFAGPVLLGKKFVGIDALWAAIPGSQPLTPKQQGQLHGLTKKAGYTAYDTVAWAIAHWLDFGDHAMNKGATSRPFSPNIDFLTKHFPTAFELWYRTLWEYKQDEVRAFLIKRGDWWHTVPGLQEKVGVKPGPNGTVYIPEKKVLTYETAWLIYLKTETKEQAAKRGSVCQALYFTENAAKAYPNDAAVQANYLAAKQASDEYRAEEENALIGLGWDGKTYAPSMSFHEKFGIKVAA